MTLTEIKDIWVGNSSLLPGSIHGVPQLAMNASPARQPGKGATGSREPGQREKKKKSPTLRKRGEFFLIVLWNGSLFILVFCCIFPLPFHAPAAACGSQCWKVLGGHVPPLQLCLVSRWVWGSLWENCSTLHVHLTLCALGAGSDCSAGRDPQEGRVKPAWICWGTESGCGWWQNCCFT